MSFLSSTPYRSVTRPVLSEWLDYNGHLNMAYYNVLFDEASDEVFQKLGLGPDYVRERQASYFTAEIHVCYVQEVHEHDPVFVTLQLVDWTEKSLHFYQELYHAEKGFLSATSEQAALHVDMTTKKVSPFPEDVYENILALSKAHQSLPRPERAGRSVKLRKAT